MVALSICKYPVIKSAVPKYNIDKIVNIHESPKGELYIQYTLNGYPTTGPIRISRSDLQLIYKIEV